MKYMQCRPACASSCCERKFGLNAKERKKTITPPAIAAKEVQGQGIDLCQELQITGPLPRHCSSSSVEQVRPTVRRKLFSSVACTKLWKGSLSVERYLEYRISETLTPTLREIHSRTRTRRQIRSSKVLRRTTEIKIMAWPRTRALSYRTSPMRTISRTSRAHYILRPMSR